MKLTRSSPKGFTLVELLVVLAIISLLAAILIPNVVGKIRLGRMTRAEADLHSLQTAITTYLSANSLQELFGSDLPTSGVRAWAGWRGMDALHAARAYYILDQNHIAQFASIVGDPCPVGVVLEQAGELPEGVPLDPWGMPYLIYFFPRRMDRTAFGFASDAVEPSALTDPNRALRIEPRLDKTGNPINPLVPPEMEIYLFSLGQNKARGIPTDSNKDLYGMGDDITSWDNENGWARYYR